jgi:hypothetical protein
MAFVYPAAVNAPLENNLAPDDWSKQNNEQQPLRKTDRTTGGFLQTMK